MLASEAACSSSSLLEGDVTSGQIAKEPQRPTVRRKRVAASRITRLSFGTYESSSSSETASVSSSRGSSQEPVRDREEGASDVSVVNEEVKRQRIASSEQLEPSSIVGDQSRSVGSSYERGTSPQDHNLPVLNGKSLFGYRFFGPGKDLYAFHVATKAHRRCQIINAEQYRQIIKVKQRLADAAKYWKYEDVEEMSDFVLPSEVELYECGRGHYISILPWQHGNPDISSYQSIDKESFVRPIFSQIVRGVAFCHAVGIIVRDLKPRKFVFVDRDKTKLRLHDVFGLYVCDDVDDDMMTDHHGVPAYVAPEVLRRAPVEYAGKPADIWALGVLFYYLLIGKHPFNDSTLQRVFTRICRVCFTIPPCCYVSYAARVLINGIFKKEPTERPTAEQLLHLRWFANDRSESSPVSYFSSGRFSVQCITGALASQQTSLVASSRNVPGLSRTPRSSRRRGHRTRFEDQNQVVPNGLPDRERRADAGLELNILTAYHFLEMLRLHPTSRRRSQSPSATSAGSAW